MANLRKESEDILADPMYGLCKDQIPNRKKLLLLPKLPAQWELFPTLLEEILCQQRLLASARAAAPAEAKSQGKVYPRVRKCHHHVLELLLSTLSYPRGPISVQLAPIVA